MTKNVVRVPVGFEAALWQVAERDDTPLWAARSGVFARDVGAAMFARFGSEPSPRLLPGQIQECCDRAGISTHRRIVAGRLVIQGIKLKI